MDSLFHWLSGCGATFSLRHGGWLLDSPFLQQFFVREQMETLLNSTSRRPSLDYERGNLWVWRVWQIWHQVFSKPGNSGARAVSGH